MVEKSTVTKSVITPGNPSLIKQGYIQKWLNYVKGYKKRFFTFNGEVLAYYEDEKNSMIERGRIHITLAKIDPKPSKKCKILIHSGTSEIFLKFMNPDEKKDWIQALMMS